MKPEIAFNFSQVTEAAAIAGYEWLGRGDKNAGDAAAVEAMRKTLNELNISGEIVIGEGEIDEAPMLYIGEKVGKGGTEIDIAVDPIDGTRMTAMGQGGAIAVLAAAPKGDLLKAPDMYMEKLVCGPELKGQINLDISLEENLTHIASFLNKPLSDITVVTLAKPRHEHMIQQLHKLGVKVFAEPDGDVAASLLTCMPESEVDLMYCIGGAPEGVVSAAAVRAMGGDMQGKLLLRSQAKEPTIENQKIDEVELKRCKELGVNPGEKLTIETMAKSDAVVFSATGISNGSFLSGVSVSNHKKTTDTLLIEGTTKTLRRIKTDYFL